MPETIIRECAIPNCTNTWEVEDENDRQRICELCEKIESAAQTQAPTLESERLGTVWPEGRNEISQEPD